MAFEGDERAGRADRVNVRDPAQEDAEVLDGWRYGKDQSEAKSMRSRKASKSVVNNSCSIEVVHSVYDLM